MTAPTDPAVRPGAAERLSRMIQLPTVSAELDSRGSDPFDAFVDLLAELYPLVHERLERERITGFGLLFRWRGEAESEAPLVLMAHYDVVPVDESDDWTHPPFAGWPCQAKSDPPDGLIWDHLGAALCDAPLG